MADNAHYYAANELMGSDRIRAEIEAQLAVAYEQHTANLIALLAARVGMGDNRLVPELDKEIEVRMGLR